MQSSVWKLLTAAGIIGIGTLVVLEVQNRVAQSRAWDRSTSTAATGTETSVTPDAQADFDRLVARELEGELPEDFDKPGLGFGKPAPPSDDSRFVGAVDRKVNKEDLTDNSNPFSMDEPELDEPAPGGAELEEPQLADASSPVVAPPVVEPQPIVSAVKSRATFETPETSASPTGSIQPASFLAPKSTADQTTSTPLRKDQKDLGSKYTFFGSSKPETETTTAATPALKESSTAEATPLKVTPAATPVAMAVRTTAADETDFFIPDTVPDVTQPRTAPDAADDSTPFERNPFPEDPATPGNLNRPGTPDPEFPATDDTELPFGPFDPDPVQPDRPDTDRTEPVRPNTRRPNPDPNFFEGLDPDARSIDDRGLEDGRLDNGRLDNGRLDDGRLNNGRSNDGRLGNTPSNETRRDDSPLADEPFAEDPEISTPARQPSGGRPVPRPENPVERDAFPEPSFPGRTRPTPADARDESTARDRSPVSDPFNFDNEMGDLPDDSLLDDDSEFQPRTLPSAEDLPLPIDRPARRRPELNVPNERLASRTRTEVLRPQLSIQKRAPNTATVGVPHKYTIVVVNEGQQSAYDVVVEDDLGSEAVLVDSRPVAEYDRAAEKLQWSMRELPPGESREIVVTIRPTGEGTLDGVATVGFKAQVKSETVITAPKLELDVTGPEDVKVGSEVPLQFTIRNRGSGDATNVILRSVLPPGLQHSEGGDLEYEIENLRAGDEERVDLSVIAAEPGERVIVAAEVTSNGVSLAKARTELEIVGAQLMLERRGPERRYVGRSALYQNVVTNNSPFEAINAVVLEEIPEGCRFVAASNGGTYNAQTRRVKWTIPRLPSNKQIALEIELVSDEAGEFESMVEVTEEAGFRTPLAQNTMVTVEDLHNVTADISRQDEPVAVGEHFGFTVTIENRGTAVARNVQMAIQVPLEIKVLAAGTKQIKGNLFSGNLVKYDTVAEIQPNEKATFQVKLQGLKRIQNAPVKASLQCEEMDEPLIVSESVTVFDDRP